MVVDQFITVLGRRREHRRQRDGRHTFQRVAELPAVLEAGAAGEAPEEGENQPLGDELVEVFGRHRELRVPIVVLEHVADAARDEGEHGVDEPLPRRLHHVVELEGGCEGVADEGALPLRVEVGAEDVHTLLLDGEVFLLVGAGAAGHT